MRTIAIIVALAVGASGCALAAAKAPGPVSLQARPDCNASKGAVVADGIAATVLGLAAIGFGAADEGGVAFATGLTAAAFIGSAVSGSSSASKCQAAIEEYQTLIEDRIGQDRVGAAGLDDDLDGEPVAPPPVVARPAPVPAPTPPTMTMRPPAAGAGIADPEFAGGAGDASGDAEASADAEASVDAEDGADIDPGRWAEFWREVTR